MKINYEALPGIFIYGLTALFVALKLSHFIAWSWIWVFSPLWILLIIGIIAGLIYAFFVK
jgi:hypothetical protein